MQKLNQLDQALEALLAKHRALKLANRNLEQEKSRWREEKQLLLREIDRILKCLEDIDVEGQ